MKLPKTKRKFCKYCKKYTEQKVTMVKGKERGSLKKFSIQRARKRGRGVGAGNKGKWGSKPALSKFKMTGAKTSKKTNLKFTCPECKKSSIQKKGFRAKKALFE
jgi:ribosomal protein L44E